MDGADHEPVLQVGTVYSWCSLPSDGKSASDYPLSGSCATCGQPVIRPLVTAGWAYRPADAELVNEPADKDW